MWGMGVGLGEGEGMGVGIGMGVEVGKVVGLDMGWARGMVG